MVGFIKKALAIGVLLAPLCAKADILYTLVGYECGNDRLTLTCDGAYDEDGENMLANKRDTQLEPHSLLTIESTDKYARIVDTAVHKAERQLSDGVYQIEIAPYPGNSNILGLCGAWVGARAKVTKGDKTLYDRVFADDCHHSLNKDLWIEGKQEVIITRVIFTPNKDEPHIIAIPYQDFYK